MSLSQPKPQRLNPDEVRTLLALDEQFAETRRGSTTMIVLAACNARDAADQDRVMVALAGLRRRHLVNLRGDRWMPTPEGIQATRQQRAAKPGTKARATRATATPHDPRQPAPAPAHRPQAGDAPGGTLGAQDARSQRAPGHRLPGLWLAPGAVPQP